ncbi:MAG: cation-translocating P-type ATPase, partial [Candidatus Jacksonbacteria bacterium]|nr:cation-translocating P-type ATPase [Candidatus Jacksonbacteria bacterium]
MKTITFPIIGMHCASCVARNERSLKKIDGVSSAVVNFATNEATVEYDETRVQEHDLHQAIIKNGYKVEMRSGHGEHEGAKSSHHGNTDHAHAGGKKATELARNKAAIALLLTAPVLILVMLGIKIPGNAFGYGNEIWIEAVVSGIVILALGWGFHRGAWEQLKTKSANMDTLISLGTLAALIYSIGALAARKKDLYFETGAVITALVLLGRYFEAKTRGQASEAIEKLMQLGARVAHRIQNSKLPESENSQTNEYEDIPIEKVMVGDILLVKPGEKIPVDGKV